MEKFGNYINNKQKGVANGVATLDATARMPLSQLPVSAMEYKGTWDADTNVPTLTSSVGLNGDYYLVSNAGTTNLDGVNDWETGDAVIFNGDLNIYQKVGKAASSNFATDDLTLTGARSHDLAGNKLILRGRDIINPNNRIEFYRGSSGGAIMTAYSDAAGNGIIAAMNYNGATGGYILSLIHI